jgi:DMSO/TMAO reductase YedYZ molybdopterin-dependent catalytic subunit
MSQPELGEHQAGRLRADRPEMSLLVGGRDNAAEARAPARSPTQSPARSPARQRQQARPRALEGAVPSTAPDQLERDPGPAEPPERRLPPGQYVPGSWPVLHYGPIPVFNQETWDLRVTGATESGQEYQWSWAELAALPGTRVVADFHCVTKFTIQGVTWDGTRPPNYCGPSPRPRRSRT